MGTTQEVLEKLRGIDPGKMLAIVDLFGSRENLDACLRGEKKMTLEDVIRKLFDHTGRCIPPHLGITAKVCDENRNFHVELPELGCAELREQIASFFPKGTEFAEANRIEDETGALYEEFSSHELVGNFFKRAKRIVFPKHDARENYGASMQKFILPAVAKAYAQSFPERKFTNHRDGELDGKISILPDTGHDKLVSLMAEKSVVVWYASNPFQGFSIFAQREAMKILTQYGFALAGGVDTGVAAATYVGEMTRDYNTPVHTCGAVSWQSADFSLYFGASDDGFRFAYTGYLTGAFDAGSGGLVLFR